MTIKFHGGFKIYFSNSIFFPKLTCGLTASSGDFINPTFAELQHIELNFSSTPPYNFSDTNKNNLKKRVNTMPFLFYSEIARKQSL